MKAKAIILIFVLLCYSLPVEAKSAYKYTTQTVRLKKECRKKSDTICRVDAKMALKVKKTKGEWCVVEYKGTTVCVQKKYLNTKKPVNKYKGKSFKRVGRGRWNRCSWTWYTTRQFPDRKNSLKIKGKHIDKRGFVCDKDGYICLASGRGNKKKHAIVPTPFGKYGKVYDTNGGYNNRWFDVYTNW